MKSYRYISILLLSLICFWGCGKDKQEFQSTGIILGPDLALCACCGGYIIEIEDSTYRFEDTSSSSAIDLENADFPIYVNLDWQNERTCATFEYIKITRIEIKK